MPYYALTPTTLRDWLKTQENMTQLLGPTSEDWHIQEVSDGNLNLVFIVSGPSGSLCCKQSLPHVRVAPDWPMPLERALFESRYMQHTASAVSPYAPQLYTYDPEMYLLVMEALIPHQVLRTALINDSVSTGFSASIGEYIARATHASSWLTQPFETGAHLLEAFSGNTSLTRITVDLILTDPFHPCPRNPPAEPALEPTIQALQQDTALHQAISTLQMRFLTERQALLHGDLHTGSIMLHGNDIRVIDGEFALMGPIGFDCGLYIGNLILHACAAPHKIDILISEIETFWRSFCQELTLLFQQRKGDAASLLSDNAAQSLLHETLISILRDTCGFCGLELIRRTIGFAQVADYNICATPEIRSAARLKALHTGRTLIMKHRDINSLDDALSLIRS
ncbi:S-methyl-5-thioribose kinase [Neokomagataea thailandica]|uniref:S-methyl-5-thioribose kinase n=1 Tax=Neokomagataea tanensis NBRC 106556 TaxID=1223519 RepID=A0ABQ0QIV2_9PROT|nr:MULTISPECIES: S-methyl-5-thioribose kinase [Neokomagataea]GBR46405.1 methylthioribose kinase [Neokomagataea tanensis NBRC 106556]